MKMFCLSSLLEKLLNLFDQIFSYPFERKNGYKLNKGRAYKIRQGKGLRLNGIPGYLNLEQDSMTGKPRV